MIRYGVFSIEILGLQKILIKLLVMLIIKDLMLPTLMRLLSYGMCYTLNFLILASLEVIIFRN